MLPMNVSFEPGTYDPINEKPRLPGIVDRTNEPPPRFLTELNAVFRDAHTTAEERLRRAEAILRALPRALPGLPERSDPVDRTGRSSIQRGGLAPWQVRRVKEYIEAGLAERLTGADLAKRVELSEHHFCRAFRVSLRQTPRNYVIGRRVERACDLMMSSAWSIGQIAIECGFADQAHFNRCFRKLLGTSPGVWRRSRRLPGATTGSGHDAGDDV
jgi:AraC-like DNA-binding protein